MSAPLPTVAAFDFDGTMTTRDTLRLFLWRTFGGARVLGECARLLPEVVRFAGAGTRDRYKARLLYALLAEQPVAVLEAAATAFQPVMRPLLRPKALACLRHHQQQQHRCVMVSASLDLYLAPMAAELGFDDLLCTRLERRDGRFTGRLVGANCRRQEKVLRLTALLGDLSHHHLIAYGDSAGDRGAAGSLAATVLPHLRLRRCRALATRLWRAFSTA